MQATRVGPVSVGILIAALVAGLWTLSSPSSQQVASSGFDIDRAMQHIEVIAAEPHPVGSEANERVRSYLIGTLADFGLLAETQSIRLADPFGPGTVEVVNVMARISGNDSTGAVVLMAHYDSTPDTPGANDNAAAVAVLLEIGRVLSSEAAMDNDVIFLFTDGEEPAPRLGSPAFVRDHPWMGDVEFVVNLESAGGSGPSLLVQTGEAESWTVEQISAAVSRPVVSSVLTETTRLFGEIGTDFDPFLAAGVEGAHFVYLRGGSIYHTGRDDPGSVAEASVDHHADNTLSIAQRLGDMDLARLVPHERSTFFTALPGVVVRYPASWAVALAGLSLVLTLGALVRRRRHGHTMSQVLRSLGLVALSSLGFAIVGGLVWMGIAAARPTMRAWEAFVDLAALTAIGMGLRLFLDRRRSAARTDAAGVVLVWAIAGLAVATQLPGAAYLFTWPALVAGGALLITNDSPVAQSLRLAAVSLSTAIVLTPVVDVFLAFAQPRPGNLDSELTEAFVIVALLVALAVELMAAFLPQHPSPKGTTPDAAAQELVAAA